MDLLWFLREAETRRLSTEAYRLPSGLWQRLPGCELCGSSDEVRTTGETGFDGLPMFDCGRCHHQYESELVA